MFNDLPAGKIITASGEIIKTSEDFLSGKRGIRNYEKWATHGYKYKSQLPGFYALIAQAKGLGARVRI
jgi:hypothetical protein